MSDAVIITQLRSKGNEFRKFRGNFLRHRSRTRRPRPVDGEGNRRARQGGRVNCAEDRKKIGQRGVVDSTAAFETERRNPLSDVPNGAGLRGGNGGLRGAQGGNIATAKRGAQRGLCDAGRPDVLQHVHLRLSSAGAVRRQYRDDTGRAGVLGDSRADWTPARLRQRHFDDNPRNRRP